MDPLQAANRISGNSKRTVSQERPGRRKACDLCRRFKVKCDTEVGYPSCTVCRKRGVTCIRTARPQGSGRPGIRKENVRRVQSSAGGLIGAFPSGRPQSTQSQGPNPRMVNEFILYKQWSRRFLHDWLSLISSKTPLYRLSAQWEEWLQSETGYHLGVVRENISDDQPSGKRCHGTYLHQGRLPVFTALPPREETEEVLETFFTCTADAFPLFQSETFTDFITNRYERRHTRDPSWWAGINIALAIGYRYRSIQQPNSIEFRTKSNVYFKNAMVAVPELLLRKSDLMAIQALIGIVYLSYNGFETPVYQNLLSVAILSCQAFGGYSSFQMPRPTNRQQQQQSLILSLGHMMDEMYRPAQGLAPSEVSCDLEVGVLSPEPGDRFPLQTPELSDLDIFAWCCRLAAIRRKIYTSLYTKNASQKCPRRQASIVQNLHIELTGFQRTLPVDTANPVEMVKKLPVHQRSPIVIFLFAYHNTTIILHQTQIFFRAPKSSHISESQEFSTTICVGAARQTALQLKAFPPLWWPFGVRVLTLYIFAAFNVLFASVLDNPLDDASRGDLELMEVIVSRLSTFVSNNVSSQSQSLAEFAFFLNVSRECLQMAHTVVYKYQS
ncbi:hypothetical protein BBP40_000785 [Aspergillus hancockii]|nr:hypothetical protein BBP40_000785 [Aspergillus hancockii]